MYEIWPNARSENKREKSKRSIFSLIRRFSERKSPFSLSLSRFLPLQHVYTHGWSWAASQAALRSFSLLGSFRVRSCWLSFDAIQKKKLMPEHTHTQTQHTQKETKKRWTLSYLFRRRNTQTAAAVYARAGSQRREEEIAWLGLAWPFTDFSLLLLELLFFHFCLSLISKGNRWTVKKRWIVRPQIWNKKRKEMKHQMRHKFDDDHFISLPTFFPPVDFTCLFPWADVNEAEGLIRQNINESREPSKARLTIKVLALQLDCCIAEAALAISFSAFHPESHSSPAPAVYYRDFCICCKDRCMLRIYTRRSLHVPVLFLLISLVCVFCAVQVALPCGV